MQCAYLEMLRPRMLGLALSIVAALVGVFTVLGPGGTLETLTLGQRLAYFALCGVLGWPVCYSKSVLTLYFMRFRTQFAITLSLAGVTLVIAAPISAIVYCVDSLLRPNYLLGAGLQSSLPLPHDPVRASLVVTYAMVATVILSTTFLIHYIVCQRVRHAAAGGGSARSGDGGAPEAVAQDTVAGPPTAAGSGTQAAAQEAVQDRSGWPNGAPTASAAGHPGGNRDLPVVAADYTANGAHPHPTGHDADEAYVPLHDRLPRGVGRDIIYVKSEGHYVRVYTTAGSSMIMMRFADVAADLGEAGMQVHRSYWVAYHHVSRRVRHDNRTLLHLTAGHRVPVSRSHLNAVRAAIGR